MKLKTCLEIGVEYGLDTVDESLLNIDLHAMNLFEYSQMSEEINETIKERDDLYSKTNFTGDSKTEDVLSWLNWEDDWVDETKLNL